MRPLRPAGWGAAVNRRQVEVAGAVGAAMVGGLVVDIVTGVRWLAGAMFAAGLAVLAWYSMSADRALARNADVPEFPRLERADGQIITLDATLVGSRWVCRGRGEGARWRRWWVPVRRYRMWMLSPSADDVHLLTEYQGWITLKVAMPPRSSAVVVGPRGARVYDSPPDGETL